MQLEFEQAFSEQKIEALFQSHIGAIRIKSELSDNCWTTANFNPTLVQLEFYIDGQSIEEIDDFNPTLVQLE